MIMNSSKISEAIKDYELVYLSHVLDDGMPGAQTRYSRITWMTPAMGDGFNAAMLFVFEHAGTHVDAPIHLRGVEGPTIEKIPLEKWVRDCCVLNVKEKSPNEIVSVDEIKAREAIHGPIAEGDIILFDFGWPSSWKEPSGEEDKFSYRGNPGLSEEVAVYLTGKKVKLIGRMSPT